MKFVTIDDVIIPLGASTYFVRGSRPQTTIAWVRERQIVLRATFKEVQDAITLASGDV